MAIKLISVTCPECGANLNIEEDREQAFCTYCGAKILLHNENEYIYRHIDEAEVKQAETDQMLRLRQMEYIEKKRAAAEKTKALKIKVSLILTAAGTLLMVIGSIVGSVTGDSDSELTIVGMFLLLVVAYIWLYHAISNTGKEEMEFVDMAIVPSALFDYKMKNYNEIEAMFVGAGFTDVRCVALNDLKTEGLKKSGMVDSITINGKRVIAGGKKSPKDATVIISYHSLNR